MRILVAAMAYNEINYIEEMVRYYRGQGCDLLIIDNCSTDGTYEWLLKNNIKTRQVDTSNAFHLDQLQQALLKEIEKYYPDWVVYTGIDLYYSFDRTIEKTIQHADSFGFNIISQANFSAYNTGEERGGTMPKTYFYVVQGHGLQMIAKYKPPFHFRGDGIEIANPKIFYASGLIINYGNTKPKEEREITYARRIKAWQMGLHRGYGIHYPVGHEKNWIWNKEDLTDIRETDFYKYIEKI